MAAPVSILLMPLHMDWISAAALTKVVGSLANSLLSVSVVDRALGLQVGPTRSTLSASDPVLVRIL